MDRYIDPKGLPLDKPNVFEIPDADECEVCFHQYLPGHSILVLKLRLKDKRIWYLIFENVRHCQGSFNRIGADFSIGSMEELDQIMFPEQNPSLSLEKRLEVLESTPVRLFRLGTGSQVNQLVSSVVTLTDKFGE